MPYVSSADRVRIFFTDSGGSGRPVVFGHGFFMDSVMFGPQAAHLIARGFRVLCWDARGHGATKSDPDVPFTYWDSARDLLAVMDAAGIHRATLAGMSQGGYVALRVALLAAERVEALVLFDTEAGASTTAEKASYRELFAAWTNPEVPLDFLADRLAPRLIGGTSTDHGLWRAKWAASDRGAIRAAAECLVERDCLLDRLAEIACPALVLRGEFDESSTATKSEALAVGLRGAGPVVTVRGAGHAPNWTHPAAVNQVLAGFVTETTGNSRP
ncbi:alpha/beta hydrolase [Nocardia panacis]|uniref:Alpha/beta hydrolase n=1 Tax=Nocardia panacis TaxID=2340916 RepID=A0A3A4JNX3_9NOCA|nr:alpha/beta hydrolase [Nocardia panacis]RJO70678.1 alpha/beta hydrolase [Nocardia panacis]